MKSAYHVIKSPMITEKSTAQGAENRYAFWVHKDANKIEIRNAVQEIYNVKVVKVNTAHVRSKLKRVRVHVGKTAERKKALVTLKEGDKIEFM